MTAGIPAALGLAALGLAALALLAWDSLVLMLHDWVERPEYSYAFVIPLIVAYLASVNRVLFTGESGVRPGLACCAVALVLIALGKLSAIHAVTQYGIVFGVLGLVCFTLGRACARRPLVFVFEMLFFVVPLPHFLHTTLSSELQLVSSELGTWMIRLMNISVYLHGNVIDLGDYKLQVVEACDGLRYLFPLAAVGYVFALLYDGPLWQRALVLASTVPLTVIMNSVRIAMIGAAYQYGGVDLAEGFVHDLQGWAVFVGCIVVLLVGVRILASLSGRQEGLVDLLDPVALSRRAVAGAPSGVLPRPGLAAFAAVATLAVVATGAQALPEREGGPLPARRDLFEFPLTMESDWVGRRGVLDLRYIEGLRLSDYLMADYWSGVDGSDPANLYIAYYESQLSGQSVHSPRTCIPGDGWEISRLDRIEIADPDGVLRPVNRVLISRGEAQALVYYWFEQRGRALANEYLVKWYIFVDSILGGRSDGALVRILTPLEPDEPEAVAEQRLLRLYRPVRAVLPEFVPE